MRMDPVLSINDASNGTRRVLVSDNDLRRCSLSFLSTLPSWTQIIDIWNIKTYPRHGVSVGVSALGVGMGVGMGMGVSALGVGMGMGAIGMGVGVGVAWVWTWAWAWGLHGACGSAPTGMAT